KLLSLPTTPQGQVAEVDFGQAEEILTRPYCPLCGLLAATLDRSPINGVGVLIVLRWSEQRGFYFPHFPDDGDRIVFVTEPLDNPHIAGRVVPSQLDPALVQTWVSACAQHHGADCSPEPNAWLHLLHRRD
ncbi:hypothetical protein BBP40_008259, partial [Aspergillus hancockii]